MMRIASSIAKWLGRFVVNKSTAMGSSSALKTDTSPPSLVVVLGSTGVGKSQLAIEIANKFGGEIISADSMQVYEGLDIITNKVTKEEMCGVPHHLLNFLDPLKEFTVVDFRNRALPILENLRASGKMAVIVGGTNYYIESLLWHTLVSSFNEKSDEGEMLVSTEPRSATPDTPTESLYEQLKEIDPTRASMIHPNDRRKIERALQVFKQEKVPQSDIFKQQRQRGGGGALGGPLRYSDAVIFWIQCQQDVLEARLDARVDKMISQGLIDELLAFHAEYNALRGKNCDYTQGIFQSIGFKEFHSYLIASPEERETKQGKKMFDEGLWLMKQVTKRYSKYQKKWINKRFLGEPDRDVPPIYGLDGTDLDNWHTNVKDMALEVIDDITAGVQPRLKPLQRIEVPRSREGIFSCEVCGITCVGQVTFNAHMTSRKHRLRCYKAKKRDAEMSDEVGEEKMMKKTAPEKKIAI